MQVEEDGAGEVFLGSAALRRRWKYEGDGHESTTRGIQRQTHLNDEMAQVRCQDGRTAVAFLVVVEADFACSPCELGVLVFVLLILVV